MTDDDQKDAQRVLYRLLDIRRDLFELRDACPPHSHRDVDKIMSLIEEWANDLWQFIEFGVSYG